MVAPSWLSGGLVEGAKPSLPPSNDLATSLRESPLAGSLSARSIPQIVGWASVRECHPSNRSEAGSGSQFSRVAARPGAQPFACRAFVQLLSAVASTPDAPSVSPGGRGPSNRLADPGHPEPPGGLRRQPTLPC